MEKEMPKLCIRPQSRFSSCLYPNCANLSSSDASCASAALGGSCDDIARWWSNRTSVGFIQNYHQGRNTVQYTVNRQRSNTDATKYQESSGAILPSRAGRPSCLITLEWQGGCPSIISLAIRAWSANLHREWGRGRRGQDPVAIGCKRLLCQAS
jgi:hypothetical protein